MIRIFPFDDPDPIPELMAIGKKTDDYTLLAISKTRNIRLRVFTYDSQFAMVVNDLPKHPINLSNLPDLARSSVQYVQTIRGNWRNVGLVILSMGYATAEPGTPYQGAAVLLANTTIIPAGGIPINLSERNPKPMRGVPKTLQLICLGLHPAAIITRVLKEPLRAGDLP